MKTGMFEEKSLESFLRDKFGNESIVWWDDVAKEIMKWIKEREKKEQEEKVDKWFEDLPKDIKLSIAENLWYELSYEGKIQEYTAE